MDLSHTWGCFTAGVCRTCKAAVAPTNATCKFVDVKVGGMLVVNDGTECVRTATLIWCMYN